MGNEMKMSIITLEEMVDDLQKGEKYYIPINNPGALEAVKELAYPRMGPLFVSIDTRLWMYRISRDFRNDNKRHPGRWG